MAWGVIGTESLSAASSAMLSGVIRGGGWGFILAATGFVVFALWLAFSRFGRIRLGRDDEQPEFRTVSWIAMMFSAGMGIGLMFYGVAEPLSFFTEPPPGSVVPGDQVGALRHGDGDVAVPLDAAPVGDLRRGRPRDRVLDVPQGPSPAHQLRVHPAHR